MDPMKLLLNSKNEAVAYYAKRDLLGEPVGPASDLWRCAEARRLLRGQRPDGSWAVPATAAKYPDVNYCLAETFRRLRALVGKYEFDRTHNAVERAAEYVFSCQTPEGCFRGMLCDQYAPYYDGLFTELLTRAGYGGDLRVEKTISWLLAQRQGDGGWAHPMLAAGIGWREQSYLSSHHAEPVPFDPGKPSSHSVTGMAIRALTCYPNHRHDAVAIKAGEFLASRFFQADTYSSYRSPESWLRLQYPFWWNSLLMALDSLRLMGFKADHPQVRLGLEWLAEHQSPDGLWETNYSRGAKRIDSDKAREDRLWVSLAVCRVLARFYAT